MFLNLFGPAKVECDRRARSTQPFDRLLRFSLEGRDQRSARQIEVARLPFIYSGFHDRPLAFVVWHDSGQYLFWRGFFDDDLDDYSHIYEVYRLPRPTNDDLKANWTSLPELAIDKVGSVPHADVKFDPTNRQWIDSSVFQRLGL